MESLGEPSVLSNRLYAELGSGFLPEVCRGVLLSGENRLFVACSGGADSVFLLYWVVAYSQSLPFGPEVEVLHFNHKLRGTESDGDEGFVRRLCQSLGIPCRVGVWDRPQRELVSEASAREARFAFFESELSGVENAYVLTGHHGDDVLETMLMRISRGSGSLGLSAPRPLSSPKEGFLVCRPLLALSSSKIRQALQAHGIPWREDSSNSEGEFYRNRLRKNVIPEWVECADRPVLSGALLSRERLEEDAMALDAWLDSLWNTVCLSEKTLSVDAFVALEPALRRRAVDRFVRSGGAASITPSQWNLLRNSLKQRRKCVISLTGAVQIRYDPARAVMTLIDEKSTANWAMFALPVGTTAYLPGGASVRAERVALDSFLKQDIIEGKFPQSETVFIDVKHIDSICVRVKRNGDRYVPYGLEREKKVSKLFIDRKVPLDLRARLPFFISLREEILWVPHLPPNRGYLIDHNTTHALQLIYNACDGF